MDRLYIVIPAYNEQDNIRELIKSWYPVVEAAGPESRLVVVNDGSKDNTLGVMEECAEGRPQFIALTKENGGHGDTVLYGYRYALNALSDSELARGTSSKQTQTGKRSLRNSSNSGRSATITTLL